MPQLKAGAARSCITPTVGTHMCGYFSDRLATDIHDDLYAKAIVLDNGEASVALVVCDLIALLKEDIVVLKERASALTGIPEDHIFVSCTHTHTGPASVGALGTPRDEAYMETAMVRAADSVKMAQERLVEAEAGVAAATCPGETFNRRWHMKDGTVRMNPGYQNPDMVRPAGPTDPEVLVLALRDRQRRPIAILANYSLHYVGSAHPTAISADYFGYFDRALQRMAGADLVGIMANGFCGDINNCDFTRPRPDMPHPYFQIDRVANVVAAAAYGAWQGLRDFDYRDDVPLGAATESMTFRRRQPSEAELAAARALLKAESPDAAKEMPDAESKEFGDWIYARETLLVAEEPLERPTPVMALRVGDLGIVGLPGEIFVEYGLQIKEQSPFAKTMTVELANDYIGYCPTDKALREGSYESRLARSAKAAEGTEGDMIAAALRALGRLSD
ncbi:MAG: hypothetical protein HPY83_14175 [Anaerolineae bacterium]|nr:hypothetical protein [Anaerolineae bacterium]